MKISKKKKATKEEKANWKENHCIAKEKKKEKEKEKQGKAQKERKNKERKKENLQDSRN